MIYQRTKSDASSPSRKRSKSCKARSIQLRVTEEWMKAWMLRHVWSVCPVCKGSINPPTKAFQTCPGQSAPAQYSEDVGTHKLQQWPLLFPLTWVSRRQRPQTKPAPILKRFNARLDLKHGIPHRSQTVCFVGLGKQFRFNDSGPISQGQKLHRFACDLMVDPLFDNKAADMNGFADKFMQAVYRTIRFPSNFIK